MKLNRTMVSKACDVALMIGVLALLILAVGSGCRSIEYSNANTGSHVSYVNFGFDTSIGKLTIPTPAGVAELDGLDSKQEVSTALADTAREAIRRVPVPGSAAPIDPGYTPAPYNGVPVIAAPAPGVSPTVINVPAVVTVPSAIPPAGSD